MTEATDLFLDLGPDRVLAAVEAAGLRCNTVCYPLNSFENRVYEVELEDSSRVIAKFYRPGRWSEEQILEEHRFLGELDEDEVPVCPVRPFPDGSTLKRIDAIWYSLSDRRGGRAPDELDDLGAERLGMLVGRLHVVAARRPAPARPQLDADRYVRRAVRAIEQEAELTGDVRHRYLTAAGALASIADDRLAGVATHRIHADLHLGNVLVRDDRLFVLDFDDFVVGPPVQDMWLAIPGRDPDAKRQWKHFIAGYERFRDFDPTTLGLVEVLRGLRMVRYTGWLVRRWHDPAFRQGWPWFGTPDYWRRETDDLEEQLKVIGEGSSMVETAQTATATAEVVELDNSDYFFDYEDKS